MTGDQRLADLFERALLLPEPERDSFVTGECAGDEALLAELKAMLHADNAAQSTGAWERPGIAHAARMAVQLGDPAIGENVGPYRIVEELGRGGMGIVYRAVRDDSEYQQTVAIKRIRRGMDAEQIIARFRAERQILANLVHPHIARLLDGGTDAAGLPFLAMEFVAGEPLNIYCEARKLSLRARLELFRGICDAVHYAHQRMVVHRDLKPGNILVTPDGIPKLLDFGIAKLWSTLPDQMPPSLRPACI